MTSNPNPAHVRFFLFAPQANIASPEQMWPMQVFEATLVHGVLKNHRCTECVMHSFQGSIPLRTVHLAKSHP